MEAHLKLFCKGLKPSLKEDKSITKNQDSVFSDKDMMLMGTVTSKKMMGLLKNK